MSNSAKLLEQMTRLQGGGKGLGSFKAFWVDQMMYNVIGTHVVSVLIMINTKNYFIRSMDFGLDSGL